MWKLGYRILPEVSASASFLTDTIIKESRALRHWLRRKRNKQVFQKGVLGIPEPGPQKCADWRKKTREEKSDLEENRGKRENLCRMLQTDSSCLKLLLLPSSTDYLPKRSEFWMLLQCRTASFYDSLWDAPWTGFGQIAILNMPEVSNAVVSERFGLPSEGDD